MPFIGVHSRFIGVASSAVLALMSPIVQYLESVRNCFARNPIRILMWKLGPIISRLPERFQALLFLECYRKKRISRTEKPYLRIQMVFKIPKHFVRLAVSQGLQNRNSHRQVCTVLSGSLII